MEKAKQGLVLKTMGHLTFWVAYFALNYYLLEGRYSSELSVNRAILLLLVQMPMVYLNIGLLIPKLFSKKRYLWFVLAQIGLLIISVYFFEFILDILRNLFFSPDRQSRRPAGPPGSRSMFNYLLGIFLLLLSTIVEIATISAKKEKEAALLKGENLNSELKFLRSQINPHFLFNTLNNLYSLAVTKSEKTPSVIMQLSNMLRYNLYEANDKEKVAIEKEIAYIKDYIALFQLREEGIIEQVSFDYMVKQTAEIAPMILIPFVENAFKHSKIEAGSDATIAIKLLVEADKIIFSVINSLPKVSLQKDETGGIGIENVRKRIALIYPDKSQLAISEDQSSFTVQLTIALR
ncbi:MAG: two-component system LytT family sensor kinase [Marivirga sp.]|jgi:two-component system LytT family sensor kinase